MAAEVKRFDRLWAAVQKEIPGVKIVNRENSAFIKATFGTLALLIKIFTLGKGKSDWSTFTTTTLRTLYVPADFFYWSDLQKYRLLRHELMHLRQFRRWPMPFLDHTGTWWINAFIMGVCYLMVLPVIFTFRAKFEREGYTQSMLSWYETHDGFTDAFINYYAERMEITFGTSVYFFMSTRKRARRWALATMAEIKSGAITNDRDNVDTWEAAA